MWMQIVILITAAAFDLDLMASAFLSNCYCSCSNLKLHPLARFPTTPQKRALPRVGHPLRAGLFRSGLKDAIKAFAGGSEIGWQGPLAHVEPVKPSSPIANNPL
jgi:hypothetical protein